MVVQRWQTTETESFPFEDQYLQVDEAVAIVFWFTADTNETFPIIHRYITWLGTNRKANTATLIT